MFMRSALRKEKIGLYDEEGVEFFPGNISLELYWIDVPLTAQFSLLRVYFQVASW
jgi:hypothetical protein